MKKFMVVLGLMVACETSPKREPPHPPFVIGEVVVSIETSYEGDIIKGRKYIITDAHKNGSWYVKVKEFDGKRPVTNEWFTSKYFHEATPGELELEKK